MKREETHYKTNDRSIPELQYINKLNVFESTIIH